MPPDAPARQYYIYKKSQNYFKKSLDKRGDIYYHKIDHKVGAVGQVYPFLGAGHCRLSFKMCGRLVHKALLKGSGCVPGFGSGKTVELSPGFAEKTLTAMRFEQFGAVHLASFSGLSRAALPTVTLKTGRRFTYFAFGGLLGIFKKGGMRDGDDFRCAAVRTRGGVTGDARKHIFVLAYLKYGGKNFYETIKKIVKSCACNRYDVWRFLGRR